MPTVRTEVPGFVFEDKCRLEVGRECLEVVVEGDDPNKLVLRLDGEVIAEGKLEFMRVRDQGGPQRVTLFVSERVLNDEERLGNKIEVELSRERVG